MLADGESFLPPSAGIPPGLWVATRPGEGGQPVWAGLVQAASAEALDLATRTAPGALIVVAVDDSAEQFIGFCFGSGRFLLRRASFVIGFGMRVALNAAVRTGRDAVEAISWVSYRTTDAAPVDGRLRASVPKALIGYGVSPGIDRVRGVRVQRLSPDLQVGRNLEGVSSLGVEVTGDLSTFPPLARTLWTLHSSPDFRSTWPHVDDLLAVEDPEERSELELALERRFRRHEFDGVYLGLPDEAEGFASVRYGTSKDAHEEYELAQALESWRGRLDSLKGRAVTFSFSDGRPDHVEDLFDLIVATESLGGEDVHLTDGDWFRIQAGLLEVIDDALDAIPEWNVHLPVWTRGIAEGDYLLQATAHRPDLLLMDRKNVLVGGGTAMEVCDIAHADGAMVHVKKRDTKGLSHLTAQVFGSATRWAREPAYRQSVLERVRRQAELTGLEGATFEAAFEPSVARQGRQAAGLGNRRRVGPAEGVRSPDDPGEDPALPHVH